MIRIAPSQILALFWVFTNALPFHVIASEDSYMSRTALDRYGDSVQLKHAREAGLKHGRLVVAAQAADAVVVVSVHHPQTWSKSETTPMVHPVWLGQNSNNPPIGLVCSGVKADASWLLRAVRNHHQQTWERYDQDNPSPERLKEAMVQVLLSFMGYSRSREFRDATALGTEDDPWARPLGVTSMIVTAGSPALLVQPSGASEKFVACAIGKNSQEVNEALKERTRPNTSVEETTQLLLSILRDTVHANEYAVVLVETISTNGIERKTVPLNSG